MPNTKFDSKSFNPEAFGAYVNKIPNVTRTELAKSRAIGTNGQAAGALGSQTGSLYARIPYFGRIGSSTSQNNNGSTDITSTNTSTYEQGFVTASRMDAWTEKSFSKNITAGIDFMTNVASQISDYKLEVKQAILLKMLAGIYAMDTEGTGIANVAAKEFITNHTYDITAQTTGDTPGLVTAATLNKAVQKAGGDNKNIFTLCIMHSEVSTNLENLKLLKYMTYTDGDGIERELAMATWNGRTVLIDDNMPNELQYVLSTDTAASSSKTYYEKTDSGYEVVASATAPVTNGYYEATGNTVYTTYVLGDGAIVLEDIGDGVPYEMDRDPKVNGGQDTLYVRDRFICGVDGISFEKPASITASASNTDLATGANWAIINDGEKAIPHKAIAICRILSHG